MSVCYKELAFVILSCCFMKTQGNIFIHVQFGPETPNYFADISFTLEKFIAFQKCLCDKTALACLASRAVNRQPYNVLSISTFMRSVTADRSSPVFICENTESPAALHCSRALNYGTPCQHQAGHHFFRLPKSPVCNTTCFGLLWRYPGGSFVSNLADVKTCDGCSDSSSTVISTTPTTSIIAITSITTPSIITTHRISPTTTESTDITLNLSSATQNTEEKDSDDDNIPIIVGVVVSAIVVAIILIIVFVFVRRRRQLTRKSSADHGRLSTNGPSSLSTGNTGGVGEDVVVSDNPVYGLSDIDHYTTPGLVESNVGKRNLPPTPTTAVVTQNETSTSDHRNSDFGYSLAKDVTEDNTEDSNSKTIEETYAVVDKSKKTSDNQQPCDTCDQNHDYDYSCSVDDVNDDVRETSDPRVGKGYYNTLTVLHSAGDTQGENVIPDHSDAIEVMPEYAVVKKK